MSKMKRFMENLSEQMGHGGEINEEVMRRANSLLEDTLSTMQNLHDLSSQKENNNEKQTSDRTMARGQTSTTDQSESIPDN